ncbi:uncharacterized protein DUF3667 [Lutibacter sp. Hel_I_33_5]|uniref:DUF3667 domain-containing protein n=1 Tax=Lutibacter sp. Hel_I_33_5 TaxID=1566289 RepID=UPI0011A32AAD|nr:DUF3667 domain-containing protein [Lutibacter sp. Hel_I_33_5]TVZ57128.1 uncharacterized protein DUF3667 [Lutibacter sp. Hel_I_33_5]
MNCKNCQDPLEDNAQFCDNCGAKVIKSRITFKLLIIELFTNVFGVDSKFFLTLKKMITAPHIVINEYIIGVRKKYINPFAYLAVGAALSLLVFNFFSEDYKRIQSSLNEGQIKKMKETAEKDLSKIKNLSEKELKKLQIEQNSAKTTIVFLEKYVNFILHNFNFVVFLFIPFYAFLSKWTYRKPHNYGEHIVINAYLQGTSMYFSIFFFFLSLLIHPKIFAGSMILLMFYYLYSFGKLYSLRFWKSFTKLIRFILVLIITTIIFIIIGGILAFIIRFILARFGII